MDKYPIINPEDDENYRPEILIHPERLEKMEARLIEARRQQDIYKKRLEIAENELAEARAEIEHKDRLIEQMREALRAWVRTPDIPLHEAIKVTEAALEAAERAE